MAEIKEKQGKLVFGLDIGTRSIVGTVGYREDNKFHVTAQIIMEHETRSMVDGQIHDINQVGHTILQVKEQLEEKLQVSLTQVCIAAAGRVLRTVTTNAEIDFEEEKEVLAEDIHALDTMGIELAYEEFKGVNDTDMRFYCVGYTAIRYYMNNYTISNLEGHKAKKIGVDLIATFLPDDVVDGLYKAVEVAGLQVVNLTLEPIAAIQVAIPEKFRMLNLALVDVGAGTSDISITKEGTIFAYGMIPTAGDSLTDIIVQHCLVEFETAEMIKRQAGKKEIIEYLDIIGLPQTISSKEVLDLLEDAIHNMAKLASDCIRELNGEKPVSAVFVVGGGGMIPGYIEHLAAEMEIAKERVAIRGEEVLQLVDFKIQDARKDALMVTPVGICLSYYEQKNNFIFVNFNGSRIKMYDNGKLIVADAALQAKIPNDALFSKRGKALEFFVDGNSRMVRGEQGDPTVITINQEVADLNSKIQNGDLIVMKLSTEGREATQTLGDLIEFKKPLKVFVNENAIEFPKAAMVNGKLEDSSYEIKSGDRIEILGYYTVEQITEFADVHLNKNSNIMVNDIPAKKETKVYENFTLTFDIDTSPVMDTRFFKEAALESKLESNLEPTLKAASKSAHEVSSKSNGGKEPETSEIRVWVNDKQIILAGKSNFIFVDLFDYIDFDLSNPAGRNIITTLNGRSAEYMETLRAGDRVEIYWK